MTRLFLVRYAYVPDQGTFGKLVIPTKHFACLTVEQDWEDNKPSVSCIPEGIYPMVLGMYHRGGYPAYELLEVPGRSLIKIHRANTMDDLLGCIGLGKKWGFINGKWGVASSKPTYQAFMDAMEGEETALITISSVFTSGTTGVIV